MSFEDLLRYKLYNKLKSKVDINTPFFEDLVLEHIDIYLDKLAEKLTDEIILEDIYVPKQRFS